MDEYEATFKVVVSKSPLRDGWYARIIVSEDDLLDSNLVGYGSNALSAAQQAINSLASGNAYNNAILETALMRGTRLKKRELSSKKR